MSHSRNNSRDSRGSRTSSRASLMSDDELREECIRRGWQFSVVRTQDNNTAESVRQDEIEPPLLETPIEPLVLPQSPIQTPVAAQQSRYSRSRISKSKCCGLVCGETSSPRPPKYPIKRSSQQETPVPIIPHERRFYDIDDNGWIVADTRGNLVIADLKRLTDIYMLRHLFTEWRKVNVEEKRAVAKILYDRYPNPLESIVKENVVFSHMGKILRSKRAELVKAMKGGLKKPSWCTIEIWDKAKEIHLKKEGRQSQQQNARRVQLETQGTSKLGSGGKPRFRVMFFAAVGRYPTNEEIIRGRTLGLNALLDELASQGTQLEHVDARHVGPPLLSQTGEYGSTSMQQIEEADDDDDDTYLPSDFEENDLVTESDEDE